MTLVSEPPVSGNGTRLKTMEEAVRIVEIQIGEVREFMASTKAFIDQVTKHHEENQSRHDDHQRSIDELKDLVRSLLEDHTAAPAPVIGSPAPTIAPIPVPSNPPANLEANPAISGTDSRLRDDLQEQEILELPYHGPIVTEPTSFSFEISELQQEGSNLDDNPKDLKVNSNFLEVVGGQVDGVSKMDERSIEPRVEAMINEIAPDPVIVVETTSPLVAHILLDKMPMEDGSKILQDNCTVDLTSASREVFPSPLTPPMVGIEIEVADCDDPHVDSRKMKRDVFDRFIRNASVEFEYASFSVHQDSLDIENFHVHPENFESPVMNQVFVNGQTVVEVDKFVKMLRPFENVFGLIDSTSSFVFDPGKNNEFPICTGWVETLLTLVFDPGGILTDVLNCVCTVGFVEESSRTPCDWFCVLLFNGLFAFNGCHCQHVLLMHSQT